MHDLVAESEKYLGQEKWPLHVTVASALKALVRCRALWHKRPRHLPPGNTGPSNLDLWIEFEKKKCSGDGIWALPGSVAESDHTTFKSHEAFEPGLGGCS